MININEDENKSIYYELDECLDYCNKIDETVHSEYTLFHLFWNVGLLPSHKHTVPIKSYLVTQNLENTKLIVWSNVDLKNDKYLSSFFVDHEKNVEFRIYDPIKESKGTVLENKGFILSANDNLNWSKGDLFRVLTLHNYGGVYIDFDVVFLRDFAPLLSQEFMYKWGREEHMINGAVMRLFKQSSLANDLLKEISEGPVIPRSTNWSTNLYEKVRNYNKNWTIFPSGFFNSEWQDKEVGVWNPMKKYDFKLYEGSFSWHWHNKWLDEIEKDSKFDVVDKLIHQKYVKMFK